MKKSAFIMKWIWLRGIKLFSHFWQNYVWSRGFLVSVMSLKSLLSYENDWMSNTRKLYKYPMRTCPLYIINILFFHIQMPSRCIYRSFFFFYLLIIISKVTLYLENFHRMSLNNFHQMQRMDFLNNHRCAILLLYPGELICNGAR